MIYIKWPTEHRNFTVGDVVVQGSNCIRGEWRKVILTKADASIDGKVRTQSKLRGTFLSHDPEKIIAPSFLLQI